MFGLLAVTRVADMEFYFRDTLVRPTRPTHLTRLTLPIQLPQPTRPTTPVLIISVN